MSAANSELRPPGRPSYTPETTTAAPPFAIGRPTTSSWREHALTRVAEHRFLLLWMRSQVAESNREALDAIETHLDAAEEAAEGRSQRGWEKLKSGLSGASVERARSQIDAAESELLRLAPDSYLLGQLPSLVAHISCHLTKDDPRRVRIEGIHEHHLRARIASEGSAPEGEVPEPPGDVLEPVERDAVVASVREASAQSRREVTRVRSFRNLLLMAALFLTLGAIGMVVIGVTSPSTVPLCFNPGDMVVCPTEDQPVPGQADGMQGGSQPEQQSPSSRAEVDDVVRATANRWDIPLVALLGFIAAAVASAGALRSIRGTSTEYSLPTAVAVLKLPTGALTAILGLLLMRGEFVPGLSALDSSAQIISWAIIFGYAQQLLTRFVDQRAQGVLDDVGRPAESPVTPAGDTAPAS